MSETKDQTEHALIIGKDELARAWRNVTTEYPGIKPKDMDIIIKGMIHIANRPLVAPISRPEGVQASQDSLYSIFLEQLLTAVIEAKSKGIEYPDQ